MLRSSLRTLPVAASIACCIGANRGISMAQPARSTRTVALSLKNKVVLITGATAGIGESCAWRFAEEGSKLILVGRRPDRLKAVKYEIQASYPEVDIHTVVLSVADIDNVAKLPGQLPAGFKDVEVIVNNAGLALGVTAVDENDVASAKTVMDTNVVGIIAMCSAFLPGMKERGSGHLINMGSIAVSQSHLSSLHTY
jgi:3-hydroxy acid dehydrogenase/malonic semialdehyde reductase